ncbi:MAG: 50S ribosomal protein L15 [Candidatus Marinimicrobia bacterium]|nr:50S ribosomal protein L15 [Candidatus Neomarinimicrobiota bacterium]MCK5331394.1 50S ribosomal protein L15 [Candidatus Neomarinimicrobiota bacterium]
MKLGSLKPAEGATKKTKRLGRGQGSGTGKTAGRGHKGAGSRSGNKKRPWFEGGQMPLLRRLPKRGFSNYPFKKEVYVINIDTIEKIGLDKVDIEVLYEKGVIKNTQTVVKVLADGNLTKAVQVTANAFSKSAIKKIEKAGGSATFL